MGRSRGPWLATLLLGIGIVLGSQGPAGAAAKIHLVIVADTLDPKVGRSVSTSLEQLRGTFFLNVPPELNLLQVETIEGEECHSDAILARIAALPVQPDDALLVFYAGHGAYDPQIDHYLKFPRLGANAFLARSALVQAVKAKRPRLGVLATDCCNKLSVIPRKQPPMMAAPQAPGAGKPELFVLFRVLFLDSAGFVDLTSSKRGEESIGYPVYSDPEAGGASFRGGLFTTAFVGILSQYKQRVLTWEEVAGKTAESVRAAFRSLKPDGLDNPDEPENPQMTQTVVAALDVRLLRRQADPGRGGQRNPLIDFPPFRARGALGIHGLENHGRGIAVYAVQPKSPAARLGLEQGDVILSINDTTIRTALGYAQAVQNCEGAAALVFQDVRTRAVKSVTVDLEYRGSGPPGNASPSDRPAFGPFVSAVAQGIRIDGTTPQSPAAFSGLDPGDVITAINGRPVHTVPEYVEAVRTSPDDMAYTLFNSRTGKLQGMVCTLDRKVEQNPFPVPPGPGQGNWIMGIHGYDNANGGIFIWATRPGSPAARLRLERGDLLVTVNGTRTNHVAEYQQAIAASDGQVELTFRNVRTGQIQKATARLDQRAGPPADHGRRGSFGAFGTPVAGVGFRVDGCFAGSAAQYAGVDPGDVIVSVNDAPVRSNADFFQAVQDSPDEMVFTVHNVRTGRLLGMVVSLDR